MLNWSLFEYKLTIGLGTLAMTAMCAEMLEGAPFWIVLALVAGPLLTFVLVNSEDGETAAGRALQGAASAWYVIVAVAIVAAYSGQNVVPSKVAVWTFLTVWGATPCAIVFFRLARGAISSACRSKRETEVARSEGFAETAEQLTDLF